MRWTLGRHHTRTHAHAHTRPPHDNIRQGAARDWLLRWALVRCRVWGVGGFSYQLPVTQMARWPDLAPSPANSPT